MSVLLLSGGLDSAVMLALEVDSGGNPVCLSFDYGQRHRRELESARELAHYYRCFHEVAVLPAGLFAGSALTGTGNVPHAHYDDATQRLTVVPNRNAVFLSLGAALAASRGLSRVLYAAHAGDRAVYPDCRAEFVEAIDAALRLACGVGVEAPLLRKDKRAIVTLGRELSVPFDLTWTCYEGGDEPCGECGSCRERTEAGA